jgi:PAS domain S-box-containing protein
MAKMDATSGGGDEALDVNATGAEQPLPQPEPGMPGRESHERQAALARGEVRGSDGGPVVCAPDIAALSPELLFTLLADNVRDYAVFLIDVNGIIRCWGEGARLMKWWTRQEAEGSHLRLLYPDGGSEDGTAESHLREAIGTGEYTGEGHRVRSDGSTFWAGITLTALRNPDGTLIGFAKVTRDFSARRAAEAELRRQVDAAAALQRQADEAAQQKNLEFVASVSHELRAPLNTMLGYISLLKSDDVAPGRREVHVEKLQRIGGHLLSIVDDLLDTSRAASGTLPITASMRSIGTAIDAALADVEGQVRASGVTLIDAVSGGAADVSYWGDEARVRQIVVNLLTNAVKFTPRGGRVTVSGGTADHVTGSTLNGPGPWVYVRVEDTGRGIPADRLEAIFEPYQQSEAADQHLGSGLGLAISRRLARLMGGDLTAQSTPGVGSTFTLWLPIASSGRVPR